MANYSHPEERDWDWIYYNVLALDRSAQTHCSARSSLNPRVAAIVVGLCCYAIEEPGCYLLSRDSLVLKKRKETFSVCLTTSVRWKRFSFQSSVKRLRKCHPQKKNIFLKNKIGCFDNYYNNGWFCIQTLTNFPTELAIFCTLIICLEISSNNIQIALKSGSLCLLAQEIKL